MAKSQNIHKESYSPISKTLKQEPMYYFTTTESVMKTDWISTLTQVPLFTQSKDIPYTLVMTEENSSA